MMNKINFLLILLVLSACASLKYEPVKTIETQEYERKLEVQKQLKVGFNDAGKKYYPLRFLPSVLVKPTSYYALDSLYTKKLALEKIGKIDRELEEAIAHQKLVIFNDTTPLYYKEQHFFSLKDSSNIEELGEIIIYVSKNNLIQDIKFTLLEEIPFEYHEAFVRFKLKESPVDKNFDANEDEREFYAFYENRLMELTGNEELNFLKNCLNIFTIAYKSKSISTYELIKERVRQETQGNKRNYINERFVSVEEILTGQNQVDYYSVTYEYMKMNENKEQKLNKVQVLFSPYLELIEIIDL